MVLALLGVLLTPLAVAFLGFAVINAKWRVYFAFVAIVLAVIAVLVGLALLYGV
jgi:hypothetical protein